MMKRIASLLLISFVLLSFCSCSDEPVKNQLFAMDTIMSFTVYGDNAETSLKNAEKEIRRLEKILSVTDSESIVSQINSSNGQQTEINDDIAALLNTANDINSFSGGALNITTLPLTKAWGFLTKEYRIPDNSEIEILLQKVNSDNIFVDGNTIACKNGTEIDFGSIAKGYAAQRVIDILKSDGITSAIITLGGNVQTLGAKPDGSLWNVVIADPLSSDNDTAGTLHVGQTAVVTSGAYQRNFTKDGKTYHHIIDPKTGYPSESDLLSVTVLCEDGTYADGLSTALFVLGTEKSYELYLENLIPFEAVFITKDKEIILTDGIKDSFTINENGKYRYVQSEK